MKYPVEFTYPPENFRREASQYSKFWWTILPCIVAVAIFVVFKANPEFSKKWMSSERTGLLEFINAAFPLAVAIIAIRTLMFKQVRQDNFLKFWLGLMVLGGIYLAGEESSWGQHYIGWSTPEFWLAVNDQQETNLHNTSHWLDQKPRALLMIGIVASGIITPWFLLNRPHLPLRRFDFAYPTLALTPLAIIVLVAEFYIQAKDYIPREITGGVRPGEYQELFLVWFLLGYGLCLYWRARDQNRLND